MKNYEQVSSRKVAKRGESYHITAHYRNCLAVNNADNCPKR